MAVAVLVSALLLAGVVAVPLRALLSPSGDEGPRLHLTTKNTTRFEGADAAAVGARVAAAVYPATTPANTPSVVILYPPDDWRAPLVAASLLRPLDAVLLPAGPRAARSLEQLSPRGSAALEGAGLLLVGAVEAPGAGVPGAAAAQRVDLAGLVDLRLRLDPPPEHALVVDRGDPGTALLAAPWAAHSADLVVFDGAAAPPGVPRYALGDVEADGATRVPGAGAVDTAVRFAAWVDPARPRFGWGMDADTLTGYRAYSVAALDTPGIAALSANLGRRGKPGPLLWTGRDRIPQSVENYLWSQRAAFWVVPNEGPFHHFFVLGGTTVVSYTVQGQADFSVEIGPYKRKGSGLSGYEAAGAIWVALGLASALWVAVHAARFVPLQTWVMRLAWPLLALMLGPAGIPLYVVAYRRPVLRRGGMAAWERPLWLQGMAATAASVGFGGSLMVATALVLFTVGLPHVPNDLPGPLFLLGTPMILLMMIVYVVAVAISWPLYQTPMLAAFHGVSYRRGLWLALPIVLVSMASVSAAMYPGMWWLMMWNAPMMPTEEDIVWFGMMFFTVFLGFLVSWPLNFVLVRRQRKGGVM